MLNFIRGSTARRHWIILLFGFLLSFLLAVCGRGTRKNTVNSGVHLTPVLASINYPIASGALKLCVNAEGLYEITSKDIKKQMPGWKDVDPNSLQLTLRGRIQPIEIKTEGDSFSLRFYGSGSDSRYTSENTYMLRVSDQEPHRIGEKQLNQTGSSPIEYFSTTIRYEENKIYAPQVKEGDHFFWVSLPGRKKQDFEINLPSRSNGNGHLWVAVWGSTESAIEYDHHLIISLNSHVLTDEKWDGAGRRVLEVDIPAELFQEGKNSLLVEAPGDTGAAAEINYIDWFEFRYPKLARAENDVLVFETSVETAPSPLHINNFSGPITIMDVTVPTEIVRIGHSGGEKELIFSVEIGHRYIAVGPKGISRPSQVTPAVLLPNLEASGMGVDYIAIGPQDLLTPLSPLLDQRDSQGLKVLSVPLEAVYDQFNDGFPEPNAIRDFMIYAVNGWQPTPRFLLLVGDATYDPRGYISTVEANRLPVIFVQTAFGGETASDALLGDVDGDQIPDIAVGRMPAQTPDQVQALVEKILQYERSNSGEVWRNRVLAIADGQEPSFENDAQSFLNRLRAPYTGFLYAPEAGVKDAPERVAEYFNDGYAFISYFGHGSINMWGKDKIFIAEDINLLSNRDRLPVIINMTCLTGLFIHPRVTSLMETLLWYGKGGAVAMFAPTSLTLPSSQTSFSQALIDTLIQNPNATLGENYLQAQRNVPANDAGVHEVLLTFLLFGDPALRLTEVSP